MAPGLGAWYSLFWVYRTGEVKIMIAAWVSLISPPGLPAARSLSLSWQLLGLLLLLLLLRSLRPPSWKAPSGICLVTVLSTVEFVLCLGAQEQFDTVLSPARVCLGGL